MKHEHPPILFFVVLAVLGMLALGGGPVVFIVLLMASPLIAIMIFGASLLPWHSRHDPHRLPASSGATRTSTQAKSELAGFGTQAPRRGAASACRARRWIHNARRGGRVRRGRRLSVVHAATRW